MFELLFSSGKGDRVTKYQSSHLGIRNTIAIYYDARREIIVLSSEYLQGIHHAASQALHKFLSALLEAN